MFILVRFGEVLISFLVFNVGNLSIPSLVSVYVCLMLCLQLILLCILCLILYNLLIVFNQPNHPS